MIYYSMESHDMMLYGMVSHGMVWFSLAVQRGVALSPYPGVTRVAANNRIIISITTYRTVENPIIASTGSKTLEYLAEYLEYLAEYLEYLEYLARVPRVSRVSRRVPRVPRRIPRDSQSP